MKFLVFLEDEFGSSIGDTAEIDADSPRDAAEEFANDEDNEVDDGMVVVVAENCHKFTIASRRTVSLLQAKKGASRQKSRT